jgi:mannitol-1-phosphate 5-dehydrogenase
MKKVLIYGAGAIGRGYLPRVFTPDAFEYYFVEKNETIRRNLNERKRYTSYMTLEKSYDIKTIPVKQCFEPGQEQHMLAEVDAVLVAVGPRNFMQLQPTLNNTRLPVICFENDSNLPLLMRKATGNENVVFAIPDVITSNTAPREFLEKDPVSVITEQGRCFIDEKVKSVGGDCDYVDLKELEKQWKAKLYLHNTPHCIAAYLGNLVNAEYLHDSMKHPMIVDIIRGTMDEMIKMLLNKHHIDVAFLEFYADKEIQRFSNSLLFDPISRVAREPFRKLARNERLIGAAALSLSQGIVPENLIKGIMAAFCFDKKNDPDYHIKYLINSLPPEDFLRIIIGLRPGEALFEVLIESWSANLEIINKVKI